MNCLSERDEVEENRREEHCLVHFDVVLLVGCNRNCSGGEEAEDRCGNDLHGENAVELRRNCRVGLL